MKYTKRFIEETFPVKEISEISGKEKTIRHGHISTFHIWWARRPVAASRATAYASLIPTEHSAKAEENEKKFIVDFSKWENYTNIVLAEKAQKKIIEANDGIPPKILDPFGGGGSIPLECLRLGCETYSNDINPVAVLIQKCTIEFPQLYGKPLSHKEYSKDRDWLLGPGKLDFFQDDEQINPLVEDLFHIENILLKKVEEDLGALYPSDFKKSSPVGYFWARTVQCQNPKCNISIPLLKQHWLVNNARNKIVLKQKFTKNGIEYDVSKLSDMKLDFNPSEGNVKRAIVICPKCGNSIDAKTLKEIYRKGEPAHQLLACVEFDYSLKSKRYRAIRDCDIAAFKSAELKLNLKVEQLNKYWEISVLPNEYLPTGMTGCIAPPNYGLNKYSDLFNTRQKLVLITFMEKSRWIYENLLIKYFSAEYSAALITYLGLSIDWMVNKYSTLAFFDTKHETITQTFNMQTMPMSWDYLEICPFNPSTGGYKSYIKFQLKIIKNNSNLSSSPPIITQLSSTELPYSENYFDAVFTDPPYYNSVPYADLSDFFYVWLKRSLGFIYPSYFISELTPKKKEITELSSWDPTRYKYKDKIFFETNLKKAFQEIFRVLKPSGISIIVYAHKSTAGWETLINSLLDSGLIVTAAYPIHTEMESRLRANESAALASSIYIICRKVVRQPTGFYNDIKEELKQYLSGKLDRLWNEGISGPDFFIAAIGSSIEVFGKYQSVIDYEGNVIRANKLLEDVRIIVTDYAVKKILHNGFATGISELTRYYVLCRWEFKATKIPFDEANKLAHSCHIELADYWQAKSFIKKDKEFIQILGPQDRDIDDIKDPGELIDVLHYAIKLWEKGNKAGMQKVLNDSSFAKSDVFFRVAQAIAETLPNESKEKKLLEGFLNLRERISDGFKVKEDNQGDFFKN